MLFIKELNPELTWYSERLYSRQTLYVSLRASILSLSLHIFTFYSCLFFFYIFTFVYIYIVLILLIFDLIMALRERRNVVTFLNF